MTTTPVEGICARCKQPRPVFLYKTLHDCVVTAGTVDLITASDWLNGLEDQNDRWCLARINRERQPTLCVPCHDREVADEERHIKENEL